MPIHLHCRKLPYATYSLLHTKRMGKPCPKEPSAPVAMPVLRRARSTVPIHGKHGKPLRDRAQRRAPGQLSFVLAILVCGTKVGNQFLSFVLVVRTRRLAGAG